MKGIVLKSISEDQHLNDDDDGELNIDFYDDDVDYFDNSEQQPLQQQHSIEEMKTISPKQEQYQKNSQQKQLSKQNNWIENVNLVSEDVGSIQNTRKSRASGSESDSDSSGSYDDESDDDDSCTTYDEENDENNDNNDNNNDNDGNNKQKNKKYKYDDEVYSVIKYDNLMYHRLRFIFMLMIIFIGSIICTKTYLLSKEVLVTYNTTTNSNNNTSVTTAAATNANNNKDTHDSASSLLLKQSCKYHIQTMIQSLDTLSDTITSLTTKITDTTIATTVDDDEKSVTSNTKFPYVTISQYEIYCLDIMKLSNYIIESVSFIPLIQESEINEYVNYTIENSQDWIQESIGIYNRNSKNKNQINTTNTIIYDNNYNYTIPDQIIMMTDHNNGTIYDSDSYNIDRWMGYYGPIWQTSPPPYNNNASSSIINYDILSIHSMNELAKLVDTMNVGLFSKVYTTDLPDPLYNSNHNESNNDTQQYPRSIYLVPIYQSFFDESSSNIIVGFISSIIQWDILFETIMLNGTTNGMYGVLINTCGQSFTYHFNDISGQVEYMGPGDLHSNGLDDNYHEIVIPLYDEKDKNNNLLLSSSSNAQCQYSIMMYTPNENSNYNNNMQSENNTDNTNNNNPNSNNVWVIIIAILFIILLLLFCKLDKYIKIRHMKILTLALRTNRIISTLFPKQVKDRVIEEAKEAEMQEAQHEKLYQAPKQYLKTILDSGTLLDNRSFHNMDNNNGQELTDQELQEIMYRTKPIADLFPETTILFADIAGFTAWSSVREPSDVFVLLETTYMTLDNLAKRRRVFKVETVGDCYVAVTGLPEPLANHAVAMARFAKEAMIRMNKLVKTLERSLGPDTGDLALRMGMHSGPVTAGVLRGDRSRFQLFGDTMNTAARMEQSGVKSKIQLSKETANLLINAGKARWVVPRQHTVSPKGKGEMQTYWLLIKGGGSVSGSVRASSRSDSLSVVSASASEGSGVDQKSARLIDWNTRILEDLLKQIIARREVCTLINDDPPNETRYVESKVRTIEEVEEIIHLPTFDDRLLAGQRDLEKIELPSLVSIQLKAFVRNIAAMYPDNPFHNFEHASHVLMSVSKLLSRIVAPDLSTLQQNEGGGSGVNASTLHDHTYGITSDPLIQFACVFSALIHDSDHPGVGNVQLVLEKTPLASYYNNQSVAEQNSIDLAWSLLMSDDYKALRGAIYNTDTELRRFRQLVVNSVMATDIVDKDLKVLRNKRWDHAFNLDASTHSDSKKKNSEADVNDRKATIVIEHLIQASDIAHTMQHWHVYRKWNERFFLECYQAFKDGRAEKDPTLNWYEGEIGFFDFYIIPLAKKLKNCGVFGVSSDEYLNYAMKNRQEWENCGQEVVSELIELVREKYGNDDNNE